MPANQSAFGSSDSCTTSWFCLHVLALPPFKIRHTNTRQRHQANSHFWIVNWSGCSRLYLHTMMQRKSRNYAFTHRHKLSNSRTNLRLQSVNQVHSKTTSQVSHGQKKPNTFLSVKNHKHISKIINYERYETLMSECQACIVNAWQHHIFHLNIRSQAQYQWDTISVVVNLPPQP